jgi:RNA polymerase sigma-70 factor (ECF subfamily)
LVTTSRSLACVTSKLQTLVTLCYGAAVPQDATDERVGGRRIEREYAELIERHRAELHAHSRRILRSPDDAEDALQEALAKGWKALPQFEGRSSLRSWLYRIVTNTSLDEVHRRPRRPLPVDADTAAQPNHSHARPAEHATEGRYLIREDFERALITAVRVLPPRQRAVFILRDALGFSARETAAVLETTVAAANSSLLRARARLEALGDQLSEETVHSLEDRGLRYRVERHADAWERHDIHTLVRMLAAEARS